ncbi:MAG TPA: 2-C-methyl-D-erythritol 2,4-cyclodiphosphate synthase [Gammaproteobacteria bacterium]|nr:2-C-methyl-D-erythritol 2,4-cyclodiphosphate synthase [Gammaproteobacteria bacterium]
MRIGHGYDAHRFAPGRRLVLGGVEIEYELGMAAHSDGDVAIHALCDAILGALGQGDIGKHFPDTDPAFAGVDSRHLLRHVVGLMRSQGYVIGNVDLTIAAQAPKLAPHIALMRERLAADLDCAPAQVNVKATTTEGMGFVGRREGIEAHAVALLLSTAPGRLPPGAPH